ncbi:MAG: adenylate/guanylate cyclase domain-containing protein [Bacteroidota bacterium]
MNLSPTLFSKLRDIGWTMAFFIIGVNVYSMIRFWELNLPWNNFLWDTVTATLGGALGGLLLGILHEFTDNRSIRRRPFGAVILLKTLLDLLVIFVVFVPVTSLTGGIFTEMTFQESLDYNVAYMQSLPFVGLLIYLLMLSVLFNFLKQVSKKFGSGVMLGLLLGRYHNPREDERIFMFLDLKASTTHAEKLGHVRFSRLLQDCFYDLNSVLLAYEAHIYKYVGDEAILTWNIQSGVRSANCLRMYFAFHQLLQDKRAWYLEHYGLVPMFKAGVHLGRVTLAEVGEYRREIEYHGDVVNTAARIQQQCNVYGKRILLSKGLYDILNKAPNLHFDPIGEIELKGKKEWVKVYSVEEEAIAAVSQD